MMDVWSILGLASCVVLVSVNAAAHNWSALAASVMALMWCVLYCWQEYRNEWACSCESDAAENAEPAEGISEDV